MPEVKRTDDPAFTCLEPEASRTSIGEGFWKAADLTGRDLIISPQNTGDTRGANLALVRLVPLSDDEVAAMKQERSQQQNRRLIARNDGVSFYCYKKATTPEEILEEVEVYRDTDFGWLFWERGSAPAWFPTPRCRYAGQGDEDFPEPGHRRAYPALSKGALRLVVRAHLLRLGSAGRVEGPGRSGRIG